jgi:hypothetical protein
MNMEADLAYAVERLIQLVLRMQPNCSQAELLAAARLLMQYEQQRRDQIQKPLTQSFSALN